MMIRIEGGKFANTHCKKEANVTKITTFLEMAYLKKGKTMSLAKFGQIDKEENLRPCLVCFFSSLNFRHSSLITLNTTLVWHHHSISITQYFSHYLWASYLSPSATLFLFLFIYFFPVPKLTEPSEKKKPEHED